MNASPITPQRLSRLRWYLGIVGLLGLWSQAAELTLPPRSALSVPLAVFGLAVAVGYLGCTVAFEWAARKRVLLGVLVAAFAWLALVAVSVWADDRRGLLVPLLIFGVVPCANALLIALDWRDALDAGAR